METAFSTSILSGNATLLKVSECDFSEFRFRHTMHWPQLRMLNNYLLNVSVTLQYPLDFGAFLISYYKLLMQGDVST